MILSSLFAQSPLFALASQTFLKIATMEILCSFACVATSLRLSAERDKLLNVSMRETCDFEMATGEENGVRTTVHEIDGVLLLQRLLRLLVLIELEKLLKGQYSHKGDTLGMARWCDSERLKISPADCCVPQGCELCPPHLTIILYFALL